MFRGASTLSNIYIEVLQRVSYSKSYIYNRLLAMIFLQGHFSFDRNNEYAHMKSSLNSEVNGENWVTSGQNTKYSACRQSCCKSS